MNNEQTTGTGTTNVTETPAQLAGSLSAKNAGKAKKETPASVVTLPLSYNVGKGSTQTDLPAIELGKFVSEIGGLLKKYPQKFTLRVLGKDIEIPGESANVTPVHRVYAAIRQIVTLVFKGCEGEQIVKGEKEIAILQSFTAVGFKFTTLCKQSVNKAVTMWWKNKQSKLAVITEATRELNRELEAETRVYSAMAKKLRADNLAAITGLEKSVQVKKLVG